MLSRHGNELIEQYKEMSKEDVFNKFQLGKFKEIVLPFFLENNINTVLDYGSGGSDWFAKNFDAATGQSACQYFGINEAVAYEPARQEVKLAAVDCVVCIDVLEHVFITDVYKVIRQLFQQTSKLLIINVACYNAEKILPCGENVHVSVRDPNWWKAIFDVVSLDFPNVQVVLICSKTFLDFAVYEPWRSKDWHHSSVYKIDQPPPFLEVNITNQKKHIDVTPDEVLEIAKVLLSEKPEYSQKFLKIVSDSIIGGMQST